LAGGFLDSTVYIAVLLAALMHAGWNAMLKMELDRLRSMLLLTFAMGGFGSVMLAVVDWPNAESWPFVIASAVIHSGYKLFLVKAYESGDLSQVYPLARGTAPLLTTIAVYFIAGELLSPLMLAGVALVLCGIYVLGVHGGHRSAGMNTGAVLFALGTSVFIAAYTIVDGLGVRLSQTAAGYTAAAFVGDTLLFSTIVLWWRGRGLLRGIQAQWHKGVVAGGLSFGSYWVALWAMTAAPIGAVAALRETSVLFAIMLGCLWLKEPLTPARIIAALLIVGGAGALRYG
jgi:drug/metabolite transporter (DMT)-like permease